MLCRLVLIFLMSVSVLAELPEKLSAGKSLTRDGAVFFTSNNNILRQKDISPSLIIAKYDSPYETYSVVMLDEHDIGVHILTLKPGVYFIKAIYTKDQEFGFRSHDNFKFFFRVIAGQLNYLGRINLNVEQNMVFNFEVLDHMKDDTNLIYGLKGGGYTINKCIMRHGKVPSCSNKGVEYVAT